MPWHHVSLPSALRPGQKAETEIDGKEILVCRVDEQYFAVANRCTHSAWPLSRGEIKGMEVICTMHGARFDLRNGCPSAGPASKSLATFPIELRNGELYVSL